MSLCRILLLVENSTVVMVTVDSLDILTPRSDSKCNTYREEPGSHIGGFPANLRNFLYDGVSFVEIDLMGNSLGN